MAGGRNGDRCYGWRLFGVGGRVGRCQGDGPSELGVPGRRASALLRGRLRWGGRSAHALVVMPGRWADGAAARTWAVATATAGCELAMPSGVALSRGRALGLGGVMDVSANRPPHTANQGVQLGPAGIRRSPRRRRPSGQPPPLPHHLQVTGVGWLIAAVVLTTLSLLVFAGGLRGLAGEGPVLGGAGVGWLARLGVPGLLPAMRGLAGLGSWMAMNVLLWGLVVALLVLR